MTRLSYFSLATKIVNMLLINKETPWEGVFLRRGVVVKLHDGTITLKDTTHEVQRGQLLFYSDDPYLIEKKIYKLVTSSYDIFFNSNEMWKTHPDRMETLLRYREGMDVDDRAVLAEMLVKTRECAASGCKTCQEWFMAISNLMILEFVTEVGKNL